MGHTELLPCLQLSEWRQAGRGGLVRRATLTGGIITRVREYGVLFALAPHFPSMAVVASVLGLALGGTTLAYICFYWLIDHVGPTRTVIVTYLLPCMALVYGALLLHEAVSINALGGLLFVLLGIFFTGRKTADEPSVQSHATPVLLEQISSEERTLS